MKDMGDGSPGLLSWTHALSLSSLEIDSLFGRHVNPGLLQILHRLGYDRRRIVSASGVHYVDSDGRRILDCWGGFGSLSLGHNHPRLAAVRRAFDESCQVELSHAFVSGHAAVLARNLAAIMPGDLEVSYLCCTGSEAVEAALKVAQRCHPDRSKIVYARNSMHGLTHGALSVTGYERYRAPFKLIPGCVAVPYGDAAAIEDATWAGSGGRRRSDVIAVVLEPIQCGAGVVVPPPGYLASASRLCRESGALLVVDEVQTGLGRTGRMLALEHEGIVPDVVTLAKALGGGKAPIAACVARREVWMRAFGGAGDAMLHASTFGGMGGACATATETLNVIVEEGLVENASSVGAYLSDRLLEVSRRHPALVAGIRGRGLLVGIALADPASVLPGALRDRLPALAKAGEGALAALVAMALLHDHDVLVAFTEYSRNVLRIEPPLAFSRGDADRLVTALDAVLGSGIEGMIASAVRVMASRHG